MMTKEALYIGIMSGTSLDGVDTALVSIKDREINLLASDFLSYPESLKTQVLAICHGQETNLKHIGELDHQLGLLYAEAVNSLLSKTTYTEHDIAASVITAKPSFTNQMVQYALPLSWETITS